MPDDRPIASPPGDLSPEEFAVWAGFMHTHDALARGLDADLRAAHNLTLSEFKLLFWLSHEACAQMHLAELAETVMLSPSGLSRAIERLQERGLVRRQRSDDDRRSAFVVPTEGGAELLSQATATQAAGIRRRFLERLTPEELQTLGAVWLRVLDGNEGRFLWAGAPGESACPHGEAHATERDRSGD
jgi:DNA-binding MarR family transcriptional regulator